MKQVEGFKAVFMVRGVSAFISILMVSGTAHAVTTFSTITAYSRPDDAIFESSRDLYDNLFASSPAGSAFASTSPEFGGMAMVAVSTTFSSLPHAAEALLFQPFELHPFIKTGRLTFDFNGHASATGQAFGRVSYSINRTDPDGNTTLLEAAARASSELPDVVFAQSGPVTLNRQPSFNIFEGDVIRVTIGTSAQAGTFDFMPPLFPIPLGPGDATAWINMSFTFTPGIPEPGTWAMMIAGFGVIGLAARRRRALPA